MKTISILLLILTVLISCETLVNDIPASRLPGTTSKLVVYSFISPQDPAINVVVSESIPIFSDSDAKEGIIEDALVKMSDGSNEVVLPYDKSTELYHIDQRKFKILASKTYKLSVSHGGRDITAICTVPEKSPVIKSYELDTLVTPNPTLGQDTALILKVYWQDIPTDSNYYRVAAIAEFEYNVPDPQTHEKRIRNESDFIWEVTSGHGEWQSDRGLEGSIFSSPLGRIPIPSLSTLKSKDETTKPFYPQSRLISIKMLVCNTDIHYFKYHRSLQQRLDTENPFTEPSCIYGNINGGLGCFGAYNAGKLVYQPE